MEFEEIWKIATAHNPQPIDSELRKLGKALYCAGLLHAAEQDEKEALRQKKVWNNHINYGLGGPATDYSAMSEASAAMHRQAASEVK